MLSEEMISRLVLEIKRFLLADAMLLSRASDEQLMRRIAAVSYTHLDFAAFNEIYAKYFVNKPARSCVAVKTLPKNVLCEVEMIAAVEK